MQLKIDVVDAFTDELFKGNSAAVIIVDDWLPVDTMQAIGSENNLSETAFVKPLPSGKYAIRWFSPLSEIPFCGHATLASAFVLFRDNLKANELVFCADAVGELTITKQDDGYIQMSFPNRCPKPVDDIPEQLLKGLSIKPTYVCKNEQAWFAVYDNGQQVLDVEQDTALIAELGPLDVVVTAPNTQKGAQTDSQTQEQYDFVSRYFWPANGGAEDPVTGSIHAGLAPYWAERLDKNELIAFQASKRGGILRCKIIDDRIVISGKGVGYLQGVINVG